MSDSKVVTLKLGSLSAKATRVKATSASSSGSRKTSRSENFSLMMASTIPDFFSALVPEYRSQVHGPLVASLDWSSEYAREIAKISAKRSLNRRVAYLDEKELGRAYLKLARKGETSIRFGVEKKGHGYSGERGDFCMVGGVVKGSNLTVFYRSLEMIGGFAYDLTVFDHLSAFFERPWKTVSLVTCKAFVFALKGNSNEKLYPRLREIFHV